MVARNFDRGVMMKPGYLAVYKKLKQLIKICHDKKEDLNCPGRTK